MPVPYRDATHWRSRCRKSEARGGQAVRGQQVTVRPWPWNRWNSHLFSFPEIIMLARMTDRSINIAIPGGLVVGHVGVLNTGSLAPGLAGDMTRWPQEPRSPARSEKKKETSRLGNSIATTSRRPPLGSERASSEASNPQSAPACAQNGSKTGTLTASSNFQRS